VIADWGDAAKGFADRRAFAVVDLPAARYQGTCRFAPNCAIADVGERRAGAVLDARRLQRTGR